MLTGVFQLISNNKLECLKSYKFVLDNTLNVRWSIVDVCPLVAAFDGIFTFLKDWKKKLRPGPQSFISMRGP